MRELDQFKTDINLTEYAASQGYVVDRRESSRNSVVMRDGGGDKIVVARGQDEHWIYFSVRDDSDNGSIIDFVQHRRGCRLGGVRQELRPWVGGAALLKRPHPDLFAPEVEKISKDRARVVFEVARMKRLLVHPYLSEERGLPQSLLCSPRFFGKLFTDFRGNAVFPHADRDGVCGYELKNREFTGFAKGGEKALWFSAVHRGDRRLVFAESGVDALSYAVLYPFDLARYASIGGAMNPNQPGLIRSSVAKMEPGSEIVLAFDNDPDGRALADRVAALVAETARSALRVVRALPEEEGADWNDVVRSGALGR